MASEKDNCVRYRNETCSVADGCTNETAGDCKQRLTAELAAARAEIELLRSALADIEHGKLDDCAEQGGPPDGYSYTREDMQHIAKATLGAGEVE